MLSVLQIHGGYHCEPQCPNVVSVQCGAVLTHAVALSEVKYSSYLISTPADQTIGLDALNSISVVIVQTSAPIIVKLTSASGADQAIPVNDCLLLISKTSPFTAMSIAAASAMTTAAVVQVFLGQNA